MFDEYITLNYNYKMCVFFSVVVFMTILGNGAFGADLPVQTSRGTFRGTSENQVTFMSNSRNVSYFLGIPFAKPPVGDLRFKRPEPKEKLDSMYDATYHRPHCVQSVEVNKYVSYFNRSEDCLYLNIYVPGNTISASKKPVMIWIYGGSFMYGGADIYDGKTLSAFNDVIVVTFNYRTSVFGFLSNGEKSTGNYGLWDQHLAIKWVHEHISDFGGDPELVTLFGESAGAASVLYQALYPGNYGFVKRVIAQSGSVFAPWALMRNPKTAFDTFIKNTNCDNLDCLREKNVSVLMENEVMVSPTIDGDFIKADLLAAVTKRRQSELADLLGPLTQIDLLSGVNSKDGATVFMYQFANTAINLSNGLSRDVFESKFIPQNLKELGLDTEQMRKLAVFTYTDWSDATNPILNRDNAIDVLSDIYFFVPAINMASLHGSMAPTKGSYFYLYDHVQPLIQMQAWLQGADHTTEIPYVFGLPDIMKLAAGFDPTLRLPMLPSDAALSREMMTMWTNFAKSGNPNSPVALAGGVQWPAFNPAVHNYLHLTDAMTANSSRRAFIADRLEFWNNMVPAFRQCGAAPVKEQPNSAVNTKRTMSLICVSLMLSVILF